MKKVFPSSSSKFGFHITNPKLEQRFWTVKLYICIKLPNIENINMLFMLMFSLSKAHLFTCLFDWGSLRCINAWRWMSSNIVWFKMMKCFDWMMVQRRIWFGGVIVSHLFTPVSSKRFIYDTPNSSFNCGSSMHYSSGGAMGHTVEIDIKLNKNHDKNTSSCIEWTSYSIWWA